MFSIKKLKVNCDVQDFINDVLNIMEAKRLGSGVFGTAYDVGGDEIIKVFTYDSAYLYYLNKISKLEGNSFIPKINFVLKITDGDETRYMVSMEKLKEFHSLKKKSPERKTFLKFQKYVVDYVERMIDIPKDLYLETCPKDLKNVISIIDSAVNRNNSFGFDLHVGNIMVRANGDFVITDPIVGDD